MNNPRPEQSIGSYFLEVWGPPDKNPAIAGVVGGAPNQLRGTDQLGYASDVIDSWLSGVPMADTSSSASPVRSVADEPGRGSGTDTSVAHGATRVGVGVLAIVLIGIGVYWVMRT